MLASSVVRSGDDVAEDEGGEESDDAVRGGIVEACISASLHSLEQYASPFFARLPQLCMSVRMMTILIGKVDNLHDAWFFDASVIRVIYWRCSYRSSRCRCCLLAGCV